MIDYDLTKETFATIQRIPIPIEMHHIKGHQDDKQTINKLPHKAQLNITCKAQEALENYPENIFPHPTLPASYPHLKIRGQTIVRQYKEYLWEAAQLPAYHMYLYQKFKWHPSTIHTIYWHIIEYAMQKFSAPDHL